MLFKRKQATSTIISCSISQELRDKQQRAFLSPSDCLRLGISLALKEREWGYDLWEKLRKLSEIIANQAQELDKLRRKNEDLKEKIAGFKAI